MKPCRVCLCLVAVVILACTSALVAQTQIATGVIQGTVQDQSGAAVVGAAMEAKNLDTNLTKTQNTDGSGHFVFLLLPTGRYMVTTSHAGFATVVERVPGTGMIAIGNTWTRGCFDGDFYISVGREPSLNLVFVRSRDGNTETDDPSQLGGGATDAHLIYEGLSRVDVDGVEAQRGRARDLSVVLVEQ